MSKRKDTPLVKPPEIAEGFLQFKMGEFNENFVEFSVEKPEDQETEVPEEPPINLEAERKEAYDKGFAQAKSEFERYKKDAEILEKNFQEC